MALTIAFTFWSFQWIEIASVGITGALLTHRGGHRGNRRSIFTPNPRYEINPKQYKRSFFENISNITSIKLQGEMIARIRPDRRLTEKITFEDVT